MGHGVGAWDSKHCNYDTKISKSKSWEAKTLCDATIIFLPSIQRQPPGWTWHFALIVSSFSERGNCLQISHQKSLQMSLHQKHWLILWKAAPMQGPYFSRAHIFDSFFLAPMLLNPPVLSSDTKPSSRLTYLWCEPKWAWWHHMRNIILGIVKFETKNIPKNLHSVTKKIAKQKCETRKNQIRILCTKEGAVFWEKNTAKILSRTFKEEYERLENIWEKQTFNCLFNQEISRRKSFFSPVMKRWIFPHQ